MKSKIFKLSKMKKIIPLLLIIILLISSAQEEITWDFPVKPGTNEWNNIKTEK